ncbi:hypothetical protein BU23DRAFT_440946, partial [Bimuria novae-zelandiae CBS 107.79]
GDSATSHTIRLNNQDFEVSENLYQLLSALRVRNDKSLFWIDQICINQRNVGERNAQGRLMSFIYSSAEAVYACLGKETETTSLGFQILEKLEADAMHFSQEEGSTPEEVQGLLAVSDLLTRSYWTRLWIVQEVI